MNAWNAFPMLDRLLDDVMTASPGTALGTNSPTRGFQPAVDVRANEDEIVVTADLPGVKHEDVEVTLDALRARGLRLCCITNKRFSFSDALLVKAGVRDRFELVLGGDSLAEKKPSPLPLTTAARTLGIQPGSAMLVGDSHQDLRAAKSAGYAFVFAGYGYGKVDETELGSSPRIRGFAELPAAVGVRV